MDPLRSSLAVICVLSIWTTGYAADCGVRQTKTNGRCCDLCPPGEYVKAFCTEQRKTVCSPCGEGYYSSQYNLFDRCEKCRSCQQEYAEKCTRTTDTTCLCRSGFLCSNDVCSKCEENKCVTGEKLKRTGSIVYSYHCEPACSNDAYFDVKENVCKPRTQCSLFGLAEQFPGNKTHNSVCDGGDMHRNGTYFIHVILGIGFVLLSLTILVLISYACIKNLRKHKPYAHHIGIAAVSTNTGDFHLSKEESGFQLIIQDESRKSESLDQLQLEKISAL
ncbi:tumor necrosis factor receptor superfamily member 18 [Morone saxatilis]|uniref:tumor necrosis factor receptor superfamily member 18 n=1 Tax=Morone saxatilis TaxID=34816 RepID=UPI0015E2292E|nr:tumor necrosis factor receptor superfamily member 18 [Morone saxatilis]